LRTFYRQKLVSSIAAQLVWPYSGGPNWLARPAALGDMAAAIQWFQTANVWQGWPFVAAMTLDPQGRRIGMTIATTYF